MTEKTWTWAFVGTFYDDIERTVEACRACDVKALELHPDNVAGLRDAELELDGVDGHAGHGLPPEGRHDVAAVVAPVVGHVRARRENADGLKCVGWWSDRTVEAVRASGVGVLATAAGSSAKTTVLFFHESTARQKMTAGRWRRKAFF